MTQQSYFLEYTQNYNSKNTCTVVLIAALSKEPKQANNLNDPSTDEDREDVVRAYNGILHNHKKGWNNAIGSNMDGPRNYHKWSKSDRDTQIPYDMWNLKYGINEPIYKKDRLMDWENRLVVAKLRVGREEGRTGNLGLVDANY